MKTSDKPATQVSGSVKGFKSNKHGDVDALEITTEEGDITLRFPPHAADSIMKKAAISQQVTAEYVEKKEPEKKPKVDLKTIKADDQSDTLIVEKIEPRKHRDEEASEVIKPDKFTLVHDKKGDAVGIEIGKKLIHLHKSEKEIMAAIKPDSIIIIHALQRTDEGFVNQRNLSVYHLEEIEIDGKSFKSSKKNHE